MTGAEFAAIRKAVGLSQAALAQRRVGIGRHAVSYWECKPEVDLRSWAVRRMAEVLPLPRFATQAARAGGWRATVHSPSRHALQAQIRDRAWPLHISLADRGLCRCYGPTRRRRPRQYQRRPRVIFDNGTGGNLLMRSLQKALQQDPAGRRIVEPSSYGTYQPDGAQSNDPSR